MNPYKSQSMRLALEFQLRKLNAGEVKEWIGKIIAKSETMDPWMERLFLACDLSDVEILAALHAVPFGLPNDAPWEKMLRVPLISKKD